ncbi:MULTISPECIES: hypothetical protein [unclassified Sphingomonas]|nr:MULTISPECIES: hypothetical protein [unclassified Sphingomonas]
MRPRKIPAVGDMVSQIGCTAASTSSVVIASMGMSSRLVAWFSTDAHQCL